MPGDLEVGLGLRKPAPDRVRERGRDGSGVTDEERSEENSRSRCVKVCKQPRFNL